jgi:aldehyde dehydrogenase (NAD+)
MTAREESTQALRHATHFIDGVFVEPESSETINIVNPATAKVFATVPRATLGETDAAIRAARRAFDEGPWPRMSGDERADVLHGLADALWRHRDEFVDLVVRQGGCTITQAHGLQAYLPIQLLHGYAELARKSPIEKSAVTFNTCGEPAGSVGHALAVREPGGVISAITPFNYPFFLNMQKVSPALAAGCTVVLKPTEYTCLDAALLAQIVKEESDLPDGVLNVLLGGLGDVGEMMSSHPMVDGVTFTGSTQTGRRIMANAAATVKRVTLELGGKSANVIFADADLDKALAGDSAIVIRHCGQGCGALSRVFVEESIHDEVVERMVARARSVVVGDPMDLATEMGPLVSEAQWNRVKGYIDSGVEQGATLVAGGDRPSGLSEGYFMAPTIFTDVRSDMKICQEEIFGPVVAVQRFRSEDEAVALANDSIFGLVGAVWSGSLERGLRVASKIRTGLIHVNGPGNTDLDFPYGGYKQSGLGREYGQWAYNEYTELKTIRYSA